MNWTGVLIEADQKMFGQLLSIRRKSYALPVCLSLKPYPIRVIFKASNAIGSVQESLKPERMKFYNNFRSIKQKLAIVQCFPLYSILLAIGRTEIDFFSLDVEGHELKILRTIPWHKITIKVYHSI